MRIRKILPITKFPHRFFAVLAVIALVAFLLLVKPIAEIVKVGAEAVGINFPPLEIFQNTAFNIALVCTGIIVLLISAIILVPLVKIAVTVVAVGLIAYGIYNLFQTFTGKPTKNILPQGTISRK